MPVIACPDCGRDVSTLAPTCPHCGRPSPAGTTPIAASPGAPAEEQTLWTGRPSALRLIGKVGAIVVTLIAVPLIAHWLAGQQPDLDASARLVRVGWLITAALVLFELVRLVIALVQLRSVTYTVTSQRVLIERGLLSKNVNEIDLRYIDDSEFFQGPFDRLLGIGNVTLISTDKSSPVYVLHGIANPRNLRETIRANAYRISQRQIFTRAT